jgi:NAD(P)-dependent dehydrogenase (short-subunit alcohol dehydrogenase family)
MPKTLERKVVVITGGSSGVGRATARAFGAEKARVVLMARNREALESTAHEVWRAGGEAMVVPLDLADASAVDAAASAVVDRFGAIDVWVNCAIVTVLSPVKDMTAEEYRRVTEVNYLGTVHGTLAALRHMLPRNEGVILQVGSALAYRSIPLQSAYCATKAAIRGFTDSLRSELLHDKSKVKLCMVQLPALNTPQFLHVRNRMPRQAQPVPPIFQPEVAARAIVYAARHPSRELWVGGSTFKVILGQRLLPWLGDRVLSKEGYREQQSREPALPGGPDNLHGPVEGVDYGARGPYTDVAKPRSLLLWVRMNRGLVGAAAVATMAAGVGWMRARH